MREVVIYVVTVCLRRGSRYITAVFMNGLRSAEGGGRREGVMDRRELYHA